MVPPLTMCHLDRSILPSDTSTTTFLSANAHLTYWNHHLGWLYVCDEDPRLLPKPIHSQQHYIKTIRSWNKGGCLSIQYKVQTLDHIVAAEVMRQERWETGLTILLAHSNPKLYRDDFIVGGQVTSICAWWFCNIVEDFMTIFHHLAYEGASVDDGTTIPLLVYTVRKGEAFSIML